MWSACVATLLMALAVSAAPAATTLNGPLSGTVVRAVSTRPPAASPFYVGGKLLETADATRAAVFGSPTYSESITRAWDPATTTGLSGSVQELFRTQAWIYDLLNITLGGLESATR